MSPNSAGPLKALKPGQVLKGTHTLSDDVAIFNSTKGGAPTTARINQLTSSIGKNADGSLHLLHFSPRKE